MASNRKLVNQTVELFSCTLSSWETRPIFIPVTNDPWGNSSSSPTVKGLTKDILKDSLCIWWWAWKTTNFTWLEMFVRKTWLVFWGPKVTCWCKANGVCVTLPVKITREWPARKNQMLVITWNSDSRDYNGNSPNEATVMMTRLWRLSLGFILEYQKSQALINSRNRSIVASGHFQLKMYTARFGQEQEKQACQQTKKREKKRRTFNSLVNGFPSPTKLPLDAAVFSMNRNQGFLFFLSPPLTGLSYQLRSLCLEGEKEQSLSDE